MVRVDVRETGAPVVESAEVLFETSFAVVVYLELARRWRVLAVSGKIVRLTPDYETSTPGACEVELYGLPFKDYTVHADSAHCECVITALARTPCEKGREAYRREE